MTRRRDNQPEKSCSDICEGKGRRAVALATTVAVVAARLVVVATTVMVPVAAARLVAVDLYVSGRMLGSNKNLDSMSLSSPLVIVGLVLLNNAHRKERQ